VGEVVAGRAEGDQVFELGFLGAPVFAQGIEVVDVDDLILEVEVAGLAGVVVPLLGCFDEFRAAADAVAGDFLSFFFGEIFSIGIAQRYSTLAKTILVCSEAPSNCRANLSSKRASESSKAATKRSRMSSKAAARSEWHGI